MKKNYLRRKNKVGGFTLIELLVVIVIIGILGAIAAPGWLSFLTRQKMNAVNSDLVSALRETQADAIQQRSSRRITISALDAAPSVTVSYPATSGLVSRVIELGSDAESLQLSAFERDSTKEWVAASTLAIDFDYRGNVSSVNELPYIVKVLPQNTSFSIQPRCVIIATLLGGLVVENGDVCDTFSPE